jgi:hypothetical protein
MYNDDDFNRLGGREFERRVAELFDREETWVLLSGNPPWATPSATRPSSGTSSTS